MKYIDTEKLIAEIERRIEETKSMKPSFDQFWAGQISAFKGCLKLITSLQQEQSIRESHKRSWIEETKKELQHEEELLDMRLETLRRIRDKKNKFQQEQPEPSNNLVDVDAVREDFITQVYRVLDADPTNDRANAIIDAFDSLPTISLEQPEVDLDNHTIIKEIKKCGCSPNEFDIARHFYELGLNTRKEE